MAADRPLVQESKRALSPRAERLLAAMVEAERAQWRDRERSWGNRPGATAPRLFIHWDLYDLGGSPQLARPLVAAGFVKYDRSSAGVYEVTREGRRHAGS